MPYEKFEIDRIKHALGDVCLAWGHLEDGVYSILSYIMSGVENTAFELIRNELDFRRALQVCKAHAIANSWDIHCDHIPILVDYIDGPLRSARNRYVHDPIYCGVKSYERTSYVTRYRRPKSFRFIAEIGTHTPVYSEEIYALARAIRSAEKYAASIIKYLDYALEGDELLPTDPTMGLSQLGLHFSIEEYTSLTKAL